MRIISIPKFSETSEIVLVNTSTLEAEVMKFSAGTMAQTDVKESRNGNGEDHGVEKDVVIREAKEAGYRVLEQYDFVKADQMDYFLVFTLEE